MKKILTLALILLGNAALAAGPELPTLTNQELEDVGNEFAVNLSHTAVAAPETNGLWGVEVGIVGGRTGSPELSDVVDRAGEDGSDFKNIYHAGLMARAHGPFELFAEMTVLPEREISDITIGNRTFGVGWNAGGFFNLPLDVAIGANISNSNIEFEQIINNASTSNTDVNSKVTFDAKTKIYWVGVSKTFLFVTPYLKLGKATSEAEIDTSVGSILGSGQQSDDVSVDGNFFAAGANVQLLLLRLGVEVSKTNDVSRASAKLSLAF